MVRTCCVCTCLYTLCWGSCSALPLGQRRKTLSDRSANPTTTFNENAKSAVGPKPKTGFGTYGAQEHKYKCKYKCGAVAVTRRGPQRSLPALPPAQRRQSGATGALAIQTTARRSVKGADRPKEGANVSGARGAPTRPEPRWPGVDARIYIYIYIYIYI